jgi:hypothetical protein
MRNLCLATTTGMRKPALRLRNGWAALPALVSTPDLLNEMTRWSIAKLKGECTNSGD